MKKILYIAILSLSFSGCEKETNWDIKNSRPLLIGDCIITNEFKRQEVRIYWSSDTLNQPLSTISGAIVDIGDGMNSYTFEENPANSGIYLSAIPFRAVAGRTYMLTIHHQQVSDTAYSYMTGVEPLEDPVIRPEDGYFKYVVNPRKAGYMLELRYDWSADEDYCRQYGSCSSMETYYVLDNIDLGKTFSPDRQQILFPVRTIIVRKKYSLNPEHQAFARALMLETEWKGGLFDAESGNVPTNFRNGMRGWFAACTVVSDTIFFDR